MKQGNNQFFSKSILKKKQQISFPNSSPIASPVQPLRKGSSISPTGTPIIRKRSVTVKDGEKNCNVM